jgi:hypothetical protein
MLKQLLLAAALCSAAGTAAAAKWQVQITNVTPGQTFTPIMIATHYGESKVFELGSPASEELATLAEGGDTGPLSDQLAPRRAVTSVRTIDGLLAPGQTVETTLIGLPGQRLTVAAMLIPTNDTFFAIHDVFLPLYGEAAVQALAYDAGSEGNDQNCAYIPGPRCGGAGESPMPSDSDEGFVHVSNGFHDLGSMDDSGNEILKPADYSWNNPVAIVSIRRIHD